MKLTTRLTLIICVLALSVSAYAQSTFSGSGLNPQGRGWTSGPTCPPVFTPNTGTGSIYTCTTTGALYKWNGSSWDAAGAAGASPAGSGSELQYRVDGTTLGAVTGSSWDGTGLTLPLFRKVITAETYDWLTFTPTGLGGGDTVPMALLGANSSTETHIPAATFIRGSFIGIGGQPLSATGAVLAGDEADIISIGTDNGVGFDSAYVNVVIVGEDNAMNVQNPDAEVFQTANWMTVVGNNNTVNPDFATVNTLGHVSVFGENNTIGFDADQTDPTVIVGVANLITNRTGIFMAGRDLRAFGNDQTWFGSRSTPVFIVGLESTEPAAPDPNGWVLFAKDDGAGKTQLCVRFRTGASQCFAVQP